ncbi:GNAT family N-acetyltransferase [Clostridium tarantellae]|uniref:GNAT family N-acetyltransferase n=1 Tax=Clostridium tarantellae TaxID=39493 RepID=A0A6I1MQQ9_9CLOT|nr:GNAT family N-acetyltransferase [Clostridium tarantellae]MPQ43211.1 GNAT family N-acetyltransferase [Clostridium tarantellae]
MEFRKAVKSDIESILEIIKQAQNSLKEQGIDQWQNNYPNIETISNDIVNGYNYVLLKDNKVIATVAVIFEDDKSYESIYEGQWISNDDYVVIHRIAVHNDYKALGLSTKIIKYIEKLCGNKNVNSIKVDTHEDNIIMQNFLKKNNFKYCGVVYLEDESKRIAFEKSL